MVDRWGLETCLFEWNQHLEHVCEQVASSLGMTMGNVRFYKFSLLRNNGQVENQSLHHDCTNPAELQEADDLSIQDVSEEDEEAEDEDWRNSQLWDLGHLWGRS